MTTCDLCDAPATFTITASYPVDDQRGTHERYAVYPMPLGRACDQHLVQCVTRDAIAPYATPAYLLRRIAP